MKALLASTGFDRINQEGMKTGYQCIFRKGYAFVCLSAQQIEPFLLHLINTIVKPIRTLKPT
jgi:hypothetical protein